MSNKVFFGIVAFVIAAFLAIAICSVSGCGVYERTKDFIFNPPDVPEVTPETPKDALWKTVKQAKDNLFTNMAIPIIALGAAVIYLGFRKLGMACMIFGAINLVMALASARFAFWMALFGFIGTALALAWSILAKNKAFKDIICNVQDIKQKVKEDPNLMQLSFQKMMSETLDKQLASTKKMVKKVKTKLKLAGKMTSTKSE